MSGAMMKRRRSVASVSSSSSSSSSLDRDLDDEAEYNPSPPSTPYQKYHRSTSNPDQDHQTPYTCNLPPTCSQSLSIISFQSQKALDRHQETFHRWVCRTPIRSKVDRGDIPQGFISGKNGGKAWKECGKVFPDERLLTLHHTETHDPISMARQARGEKIFECLVPPPGCKKVFLTPAQRRRHLIDKHRYPEQYFFSVTNHGINRIAQEDGLGISLIRPKKEYSKQPDQTPLPTDDSLTRDSPIHASGSDGNDDHNGNNDNNDNNGSNRDGREKGMLRAENEIRDVEMDGLIEGLNSSLQFIPKGVRKKQTSKV